MIIGSILMILNTPILSASLSTFRFEHLSTQNGLSHNSVIEIVQDRQGFMWFGTLNGLNRYDRSPDRFVRIYHDPGNPNSLVDNRIRRVMEDHTGQIRIGTEGGLSIVSGNPVISGLPS